MNTTIEKMKWRVSLKNILLLIYFLIFIERKRNKEYLTMFKMRLKKLLKTALTGKGKIKAINTWAIPTLIYSFGILQ